MVVVEKFNGNSSNMLSTEEGALHDRDQDDVNVYAEPSSLNCLSIRYETSGEILAR